MSQEIKTPIEIEQETSQKKESDKIAFNNNLVMDLTLKVNRINFILTNLLDINNANEFKQQMLDLDHGIVDPNTFNEVQDNLLKVIGALSKIVQKFYFEKKGDK